MTPTIDSPLTLAAIRRFYNWLGARHDMGSMFEREAKSRGFELLNVQPGERVLNAGAGTGKDNARLLAATGATGQVVAVDVSEVMLQLGLQNAPAAKYCQASVAALPFRESEFDGVIATYVLDLLSFETISAVLTEFRRVLRPEGRLVLVSLTEGTEPISRGIVSAWKAAYALHPFTCGGCRPLQLRDKVEAAGIRVLTAEVVAQLGVPSEVILARKNLIGS